MYMYTRILYVYNYVYIYMYMYKYTHVPSLVTLIEVDEFLDFGGAHCTPAPVHVYSTIKSYMYTCIYMYM